VFWDVIILWFYCRVDKRCNELWIVITASWNQKWFDWHLRWTQPNRCLIPRNPFDMRLYHVNPYIVCLFVFSFLFWSLNNKFTSCISCNWNHRTINIVSFLHDLTIFQMNHQTKTLARTFSPVDYHLIFFLDISTELNENIGLNLF